MFFAVQADGKSFRTILERATNETQVKQHLLETCSCHESESEVGEIKKVQWLNRQVELDETR
jgi:hypothetical protein